MVSAGSISIVIMVTRTDFQVRTRASTVSHFPPVRLLVPVANKILELDLPEYETYEALRQQVLTAITAGSEYFGFA
jgi:hypothetical protein